MPIFLHSLATSENIRFSNIFRGYRKIPVAWNRLMPWLAWFGYEISDDTHREKLCFIQFSTKNGWLAASDLFHMFTQWIKFVHSIIHVRVKMFEKCDSSNRQKKWMVAPFSKFYGKVWVGFCLNTGKRFFLCEMWNIFNTLPLKQNFWKTKIFFKKLKYHFLVEGTKIENTSFPYKTAISEVNVKTNRTVNAKWTYQKERSFASNYFIFLKILFQFKNPL